MTVCNGRAAREGTPDDPAVHGWRFACPVPHPLVGDPRVHMVEVGERYVSLIVLDEPEVAA